MAQIIKASLKVNPKARDMWQDRVKTYQVNRDLKWKNGRLNLEFVGNKVEVIASLFVDAKAEILIDGKHPGKIPDLYVFTRANYTPKTDWPWEVTAPFRISWETPPQEEDWQLKILQVQARDLEGW